MRSLNSICRARDEARYVSRTWARTSEYVYQDQPAMYIPDAETTYGSQENKDRWYTLEVRALTGGKLFTPEIAHVANGAYSKAIGAKQFQHHFTLHSNPEELLQYIDLNLYEVTYNQEVLKP